MRRYNASISTAGGGVTISGGEPLLQPVFTSAVLSGAKETGLHTALDTSGALGARADDGLLDATDLVLLDIKAVAPGSTPTSLGAIWLRPCASPSGWRLGAARSGSATCWCRVGTTAPDQLERHAAYVAGLSNVGRVDVLGYHRLGREKCAEHGLVDRLGGSRRPRSHQNSLQAPALSKCPGVDR